AGRTDVFLRTWTIWITRIEQQTNRCRRWDELVQQSETFGCDRECKKNRTRYVSVRLVPTFHKSEFDRIAAQMKQDWNCRSGLHRSRHWRRTTHRNDNGHLALDQLFCEGRQPLISPFSPAIFDREIPALDVAYFREAHFNGSNVFRIRWRGCSKYTDGCCRLLCDSRQRPKNRSSGDLLDELPAFHSSTSSARASRVGGT